MDVLKILFMWQSTFARNQKGAQMTLNSSTNNRIWKEKKNMSVVYYYPNLVEFQESF